jgi:prepilin-type N-terminal cleavage/methylation domain-containing protein
MVNIFVGSQYWDFPPGRKYTILLKYSSFCPCRGFSPQSPYGVGMILVRQPVTDMSPLAWYQRTWRRPFTMVELMVVMAIISILASMLLPALARARRRSAEAGCTNNLKMNYLGFEWYADDNNEPGYAVDSRHHNL